MVGYLGNNQKTSSDRKYPSNLNSYSEEQETYLIGKGISKTAEGTIWWSLKHQLVGLVVPPGGSCAYYNGMDICNRQLL